MNIICEYCKTEFKNNSSLRYHQKNAKYCLEIQGKKQDKFICNLCEKILSSKQKLEHHQTICIKNKREINLEIVTHEQEETILKQKIEINNLKDQLQKQEKNYKEQLQKQEDNYKEQLQKQEENHKSQTKVFQEIIEKMGLRAIDKPTTTNNTTNNNTTTLNIATSIDFNDTDKIKNIINDDFNIDYAVNGQKGLARFVTDKFLTDKDGKLLYICTDPSRQIFKYKDSTGEIKKDVEAKKLTNYIVDGGIKQKTLEVANDWYIDDEGKMDINKFNIMLDQQQSIFKIKDDNNSFKKELVTLTIK